MADQGTAFDKVLGRLRYDFPEAPEALLVDMLVEAGRHVADSELIEYRLDLTNQLQESIADYDYGGLLPEGMCTKAIKAVEYCGCCLEHIDPKCHPCPEGYERCAKNAIRLHPCPGPISYQTLELCLCLKPDEGAYELPDDLVDLSHTALLNFARSEMYCLPEQEFTNVRASRAYRDKARHAMRDVCKEHEPDAGQHRLERNTNRATGRRWWVA